MFTRLAVNRRRLATDDGGFTLVELMVVIVLLGIVGGFLTSSVVTGLRTSRTAQERVYTLAELERTAQNMSREIRAADPVLGTPTDDTLRVTILRGGGKRIITYDATGGQLRQTVAEYASVADATPTSTSTTTLIADLDPAANPVFTYSKADGSAWDPTASPADPVSRLAQVDINLVSVSAAGQPIQVETAVFIRNVQDGRT